MSYTELELYSSRAFLTGLEQVCPLNCLEDSTSFRPKMWILSHLESTRFLLDRVDAYTLDISHQFWHLILIAFLSWSLGFAKLIYNKNNIYQCITCHSIIHIYVLSKYSLMCRELFINNVMFCPYRLLSSGFRDSSFNFAYSMILHAWFCCLLILLYFKINFFKTIVQVYYPCVQQLDTRPGLSGLIWVLSYQQTTNVASDR